ncbi:MAG: hypothetical protein PHC70_03915 [Patescibacteria group bacterium]|nr:hypothetical protein [Patescibacteria group bacterium]
MADSLFRFNEIEYGNSPTDDKIVGVFRFEQAQAGKTGPQHVVVAEVSSTLYAYERLLDLISTTVEQSRALTAGMTMDPFARFEKLVQRLNDAVASFQEKEPTPLNWSRVNIFLIECSQDQLCVSGHGRLMNLFLQSKPDGTYQAFDLCGSLEQPSTPDPKKIFASIVCGDMKPGDLFFIGSSSFDRLREDLKVKSRLMSLPPVSASMEIRQDLEQMRPPDDFAAILISCHTADKQLAAIPVPSIKGALESMKQLRENELQTNQTLAPILNPVKSSKPTLNTEADPKQPKPARGVGDLWQKAKSLIPAPRPRPTPATQTAMRSLDAGHGSVFTKKRKLVIGAVIGGILLLLIGYLTYSYNRKVATERAAWEQKFAQAADLRNRAESSLMYAKDSETKASVDQAMGIVNALDTSNNDRKQRVTGLKTELSQINEKLRKASVATNVVELFSLPVTAADGSLTAPVMTDKTAYTVNNQDHQVVAVDIASHTAKTSALPSGSGRIVAGSIGEKSLVLLDDKGQFYAMNLDDNKVQALNKMSQASSSVAVINDMVVYNKKAYILDGTKGLITRLVKTSTGFGSPSTYAKADAVPLTGSVAMAIDSNVFVAKSDGSVLRLLSGKQEAFGLSAIDPQLRSIASIWTEMDDPRIMVTDPADKRLVIFDKTGLLTAQITSPDFSGIRAASSKLGQKQALVVSGNRLLLVPLP